MGGTVDSIQVVKYLAKAIKIINFSASGTSDNVTTVITNVLQTAGEGSTPLNLSISSPLGTEGVVTTGSYATVNIIDHATGEKLKDDNGNEVFGTLSEASNVYTLSYVVFENGQNNASTSFDIGTRTIDFKFGYISNWNNLDWWALIDAGGDFYNADPKAYGRQKIEEGLVISGTNTVNPLSQMPIAGEPIKLSINGLGIKQGREFTISGKDITIISAVLKYAFNADTYPDGTPKWYVDAEYYIKTS